VILADPYVNQCLSIGTGLSSNLRSWRCFTLRASHCNVTVLGHSPIKTAVEQLVDQLVWDTG
jgi:hypothetical protein